MRIHVRERALPTVDGHSLCGEVLHCDRGERTFHAVCSPALLSVRVFIPSSRSALFLRAPGRVLVDKGGREASSSHGGGGAKERRDQRGLLGTGTTHGDE